MHAVTPADEPLRVVVVSGEPGGIGTALCLPTRLRRRMSSRVSDMTVIHRGEPLLLQWAKCCCYSRAAIACRALAEREIANTGFRQP